LGGIGFSDSDKKGIAMVLLLLFVAGVTALDSSPLSMLLLRLGVSCCCEVLALVVKDIPVQLLVLVSSWVLVEIFSVKLMFGMSSLLLEMHDSVGVFKESEVNDGKVSDGHPYALLALVLVLRSLLLLFLLLDSLIFFIHLTRKTA
jgi:hypothetical protein